MFFFFRGMQHQIIPRQGIKPVPLHWGRGVLTTEHQGSPCLGFLMRIVLKSQMDFVHFQGTLNLYYYLIKKHYWDFPGGPVVNSLLANGGDRGSIPGPGRFHMLWVNSIYPREIKTYVHTKLLHEYS